MQIVRTGLLAVSLLGVVWPAQAQSEVFAIAQSGDGAKVLLYAKAGPCIGQARLAEHIALSGAKTPGCWLATESYVLISFLDGERGHIPVGDLKKVSDI
jgi:hypothetical protein